MDKKFIVTPKTERSVTVTVRIEMETHQRLEELVIKSRRSQIEHLYNTGNHNKIMTYIESKANDIPVLKEFINASAFIKDFKGHIITTHHKILYAPTEWLKNYNIVVDEDILKTITKNQISVEISDIEKLLEKKISDKVRKHLVNLIELADENSIYFGNSEGCNCMKGQDMAVIGTPHMADFLYILLAYQIGYSGENDKLRYQEVKYSGYKFWLCTYSNELLRRIQFWMIESELEQSVGRAGLLREDCTVWLFSDFPLVQAELIKS